MAKYTFLIASARTNGNSEQLARLACQSLPEDDNKEWLSLSDLPLPPFVDQRHDSGSYPQPTGNEKTLHDATASCDHLVFVAPVYWYNVPAPLKLYLDYWSAWMRVDGLDFKEKMKGKNLWAISASAGPAEEAGHMFESLRLCANYMAMNWRGHLLGNGTLPGDAVKNIATVEMAKHLFA